MIPVQDLYPLGKVRLKLGPVRWCSIRYTYHQVSIGITSPPHDFGVQLVARLFHGAYLNYIALTLLAHQRVHDTCLHIMPSIPKAHPGCIQTALTGYGRRL
jgi:hypothetical protein